MSLALSVAFLTSCGDDDDDDGGSSGPSISNGIYAVQDGEEPSDANKLATGYVAEDETRSGFKDAYIYLSGSFNFVEYVDDVATSYGGEYTMIPMGTNTEAELGEGDLMMDGAAIAPISEGLHHIHFDETSAKFYITKVDYFEIIGSSTADTWNSGQKLAVKSASADEVVYEGTNITLRAGEYKFRYNANWDTQVQDAAFNVHSNFGEGVKAAGANLPFDEEDGNYTVTVTYTPGPGASLAYNLERTGDAEEITFDPAEYNFGAIGDGTAGGWDSDRDLFYVGEDDAKGHVWAGIVYLNTGAEFKFRTNDDWAFSVGGVLELDADPVALVADGDNIATYSESGAYYFEIYTSDEGSTWMATANAASWGVIGDGSPQGNWDADMDMTALGFADGVTTYEIDGTFTDAGWKFRANDDWAVNLGGALDGLTLGGDNLTAAGGKATLTISLADDGTTKYTTTVE